MLNEHYQAARNGAALVRQNSTGILKLTGPERQTWLQGMVSNEVEKLMPGQGCYAAHLNAQGKIVAQLIVLVAEEEVWLLLERSATEKLAMAFDRLIIMEDVQVHDVSDQFEVLEVLGPTGAKVLSEWAQQTIQAGPLYHHQRVAGGRVFSSDLGFAVIVARDSADHTVQSLVASGASEIDSEIWNVVRAEAGLPVYGVDIDETTTLPELGQRGISYDKGCYIGQEVVARIKYIGHVNRRFVGFVCEGSAVPEARSVVQAGGKDVGFVTTGVFSPGLGKAIALGFVSRTAAEPGTPVVVAGREVIRASVSGLPIIN